MNRPKPTHLKLVQGNPGKRRLNKQEPKPRAEIPVCPEHLTAEGKAEWERICPLLHECGLLTQIDRAALASYCQAWSHWVMAEKMMAATGPIIRSPNKNYPQF